MKENNLQRVIKKILNEIILEKKIILESNGVLNCSAEKFVPLTILLNDILPLKKYPLNLPDSYIGYKVDDKTYKFPDGKTILKLSDDYKDERVIGVITDNSGKVLRAASFKDAEEYRKNSSCSWELIKVFKKANEISKTNYNTKENQKEGNICNTSSCWENLYRQISTRILQTSSNPPKCEKCHVTINWQQTNQVRSDGSRKSPFEIDMEKGEWCVNTFDFGGSLSKNIQGVEQCPNSNSVLSMELGISQVSDKNTNKIMNVLENGLRKNSNSKASSSNYYGATPKSDKYKEKETKKTDTHHDVLSSVGLVTAFIPQLRWVGFAADLLNAGLYYNEGKTYEAGLNLIFGLLTMPNVATKFLDKGIQITPELEKKLILLKNEGKLETLTAEEASKIFTTSELKSINAWRNSSNYISDLVVRESSKNLLKKFAEKGVVTLKNLINAYKGFRNNLGMMGMVLEFGGATYTYTQLYDKYNKSSEEEKKKLEQQFNDQKGKEQFLKNLYDQLGLQNKINDIIIVMEIFKNEFLSKNSFEEGSPEYQNYIKTMLTSLDNFGQEIEQLKLDIIEKFDMKLYSCKGCNLTISGDIYTDIKSKQLCINQDLLDNGKFECNEYVEQQVGNPLADKLGQPSVLTLREKVVKDITFPFSQEYKLKTLDQSEKETLKKSLKNLKDYRTKPKTIQKTTFSVEELPEL
jgi:hypothetical protein